MSEEHIVNIKQRLIGAIVLVSLGVIIIPLLLNGGPVLEKTISSTNIPAIPDKLNKKLPEIPQPDVMPKPKLVSSRPVGDMGEQLVKTPDTKQLSKSNPEKTTNQFKKVVRPGSKQINMAYTLQIASFSKKSNALALRDRLRKGSFNAYIESINTANGKIYRLRVGPYLKYDQLSGIKQKIEKQFKLSNTVIVKYKT